MRILKEKRNKTIINTNKATTIGTTEGHAFGEGVSPTEIPEPFLSRVQ